MADDVNRPILGGGENLRREVERSTGGAPKYRPQSFRDAQANLGPQITRLMEDVEALPDRLRTEQVVFQATLLPNFLAGSYFPAALLQQTGLKSIGSRSATGVLETRSRKIDEYPTKSLILSGARSKIPLLSEFLSRPEEEIPVGVRDGLVEFSEFRLPRENEVVKGLAEVEVGAGEVLVWESVLHRLLGDDEEETALLREETLDKWSRLITNLGGAVVERYARSVRGLTFVPIELPVEAVREAARFNPLRVVRPMPHLRPIIAGPFRSSPLAVPQAPPSDVEPLSDETIAVFDGGIDTSFEHTRRFVRPVDVTDQPPEQSAVDHGTLVTTSALYGYVEPGAVLDRPAARIDHFRVYPVPVAEQHDHEYNWILDQIVEIVRENRYRVVNLSLGPDLCVDDSDEPNRWTAELDALSHDVGTLFVVAVGNVGRGDDATGQNRVQLPADMVNGLSVGACTARSPDRQWDRAPYSAVGPGRWGARVKPTGLAFGGVTTNQFVGIGPGPAMVAPPEGGTSFAAPLVTHAVAGLSGNLPATQRSVDLLRAFAIHTAERRRQNHRMVELGFGRLVEHFHDVVDCGENEVTAVYRDQIRRDEVVALPFPLPPKEFDGRIKVRWTLSYTSSVEPAEAVDYARWGLTATFRPHINRYRLRDPDTGKYITIDVQEEREEFEDLVRRGAKVPANPMSYSGREFRINEQRQRDAGKWETVLHHRFSRAADELYEPRLDLSFFAREGGSLVSEDIPPLSYVMLVTLRAPEGSSLYEEAAAHFDVLTPLTIPVRAQIPSGGA